MILILAAAVAVAIGFSFLCSLMEATLYAVPLAHVKHLAESDSRSGKLLLRYKESIEQPIAAILILNTISNTAGAAVAGSQVSLLWGERGLIVFSVLFTLAILLCLSLIHI